MLRNRVITVLTFHDGVLCRSRNFNPDYRYTSKFVDLWSVDEVVLLDITRQDMGNKDNFYKTIEYFAENAFVPLAVGGGVRTLDDVKTLFSLGADKIVVNKQLVCRPKFISEIASSYGSQAVVASIDAKHAENGGYQVYTDFGREDAGCDPVALARRAEELGAGEIMITSIERDGMLEGYDNELNRAVSEAVTVPVIVCGGAGKWQDFVDGFEKGKASGVGTTCIYHFTETSIKSAKIFLKKKGIEVRL